jgi:hypothetical protein
LIPFRPINGADNQYGQLYCKFQEHSYKEAGFKGFTPPMPVVVPAQFLTTNDALCFNWPTLAELNEKILANLGPSDKGEIMDSGNSICSHPRALYRTPTIHPFMLHSSGSLGKYTCPAHHQQCQQTVLHLKEDCLQHLQMAACSCCPWPGPLQRIHLSSKMANTLLIFILLIWLISGTTPSINNSGCNIILKKI